MEGLYYSVNLDNERTLCIAPLTDHRIAMSGQEIENTDGYFLFEKQGPGDFARIEVIAQVLSTDGVMRMRDFFRMS